MRLFPRQLFWGLASLMTAALVPCQARVPQSGAASPATQATPATGSAPDSTATDEDASKALQLSKEPVGLTLDKPLVVGTCVMPPFSFKSESGEWTGVAIDLWEAIAQKLDLPYAYKEYDLPSLLKAIKAGQVDVGVSGLTVTANRVKEMEMTHTFFGSGLGIATEAEYRDMWEGFIERFFSWTLFKAIMVLFGVLLVAGVLIWLFERKANPQFGGSSVHGIGDGLWWSAVTMTTVGYGDKAPVTTMGRVIGLIWMFTSIIVISGLTGAIATALTLGQLQGKVGGLKDLAHVRTGVVADSTAQEYLAAQGIRAHTYTSVNEGLRAVDNNELDAFVDDHLTLTYWVAQDYASKLIVLPQTFDTGYYALALPPHSPWRAQLDLALLEILEQPAWDAIIRKYRGM